ncbi:MAG: hypothetical protein A2W95_01410 [Bacteroidetes bacterium GWA2_40_14]|nr:MAG: hypothetical protein A2W95_01410 [Bacteroidetes bacterium GWA2_40_14]
MKTNSKHQNYSDYAKWLADGNHHEAQSMELKNLSREQFKEFETCTKTWEIINHMQEIQSFDTDKAWNNLHQRLSDENLIKAPIQTKLPMRTIWSVAASIVVLIGITSVWYFNKPTSSVTTIANHTEVPQRIELPDGSVVFLNVETQLTYNPMFNQKQREVTLLGEAFFEVTPNAQKPFVVAGTASSVKVLGTSFNVTTRQQFMEVVVATGKVEVYENTTQQNKVILLPGDKGTYREGNLDKTSNEHHNFKSWVDHKLVFKAVTLDEAIRDINHAYHSQIEIGDSSLNNLLITTTFDDISLDEIVASIALALEIDIDKKGESYRLVHW